MALKLNERYPGRFDNPSGQYPQGSFKNRSAPDVFDGSYLEKDWANDKEGLFQSLLVSAGITPNGDVDAVGSSQYFNALLQLIATESRTFPGQIIWVAGDTAPDGTLKANFAAVSRTVYARLFAAIGTRYGAGNGTTTFNLPEMRGEFPRGWDDGRGIDPSRILGSSQASSAISYYANGNSSAAVATPLINGDGQITSSSGVGGFRYETATRPAQASEAFNTIRPRNIALMACIVY